MPIYHKDASIHKLNTPRDPLAQAQGAMIGLKLGRHFQCLGSQGLRFRGLVQDFGFDIVRGLHAECFQAKFGVSGFLKPKLGRWLCLSKPKPSSKRRRQSHPRRFLKIVYPTLSRVLNPIHTFSALECIHLGPFYLSRQVPLKDHV